MCTSRCFGGTDASSVIAIWMGVCEIWCTCRSGETADACGQMVTGWGVQGTLCTCQSVKITDACSEMAVWMGVWESGCTCRLGETADACGGELVVVGCSWLVLESWRDVNGMGLCGLGEDIPVLLVMYPC